MEPQPQEQFIRQLLPEVGSVELEGRGLHEAGVILETQSYDQARRHHKRYLRALDAGRITHYQFAMLSTALHAVVVDKTEGRILGADGSYTQALSEVVGEFSSDHPAYEQGYMGVSKSQKARNQSPSKRMLYDTVTKSLPQVPIIETFAQALNYEAGPFLSDLQGSINESNHDPTIPGIPIAIKLADQAYRGIVDRTSKRFPKDGVVVASDPKKYYNSYFFNEGGLLHNLGYVDRVNTEVNKVLKDLYGEDYSTMRTVWDALLHIRGLNYAEAEWDPDSEEAKLFKADRYRVARREIMTQIINGADVDTIFNITRKFVGNIYQSGDAHLFSGRVKREIGEVFDLRSGKVGVAIEFTEAEQQDEAPIQQDDQPSQTQRKSWKGIATLIKKKAPGETDREIALESAIGEITGGEIDAQVDLRITSVNSELIKPEMAPNGGYFVPGSYRIWGQPPANGEDIGMISDRAANIPVMSPEEEEEVRAFLKKGRKKLKLKENYLYSIWSAGVRRTAMVPSSAFEDLEDFYDHIPEGDPGDHLRRLLYRASVITYLNSPEVFDYKMPSLRKINILMGHIHAISRYTRSDEVQAEDRELSELLKDAERCRENRVTDYLHGFQLPNIYAHLQGMDKEIVLGEAIKEARIFYKGLSDELGMRSFYGSLNEQIAGWGINRDAKRLESLEYAVERHNEELGKLNTGEDVNRAMTKRKMDLYLNLAQLQIELYSWDHFTETESQNHALNLAYPIKQTLQSLQEKVEEWSRLRNTLDPEHAKQFEFDNLAIHRLLARAELMTTLKLAEKTGIVAHLYDLDRYLREVEKVNMDWYKQDKWLIDLRNMYLRL